MEFIILDNEWNTTYSKKQGRCVNELIEMGAVKFDDKLNEVSRFSVLIHSSLCNKLSNRFKELTNITNDEMQSSKIDFYEAVEMYSKWAGKNAVTLTWSNSDLYVILENFRIFNNQNSIPFIYKYIDLQKYIQNQLIKAGNKLESQISLKNAATLFDISTDNMELHRALDDSLLCLEILKKVYNKKELLSYSVDTKSKDYYDRLTFKAYVIKNIDNPLINRKKMLFECDVCNKKAERTSQWIFKGKSFRADFYCKKCNRSFQGNVSFKKYYDHVVVKRRTVQGELGITENA